MTPNAFVLLVAVSALIAGGALPPWGLLPVALLVGLLNLARYYRLEQRNARLRAIVRGFSWAEMRAEEKMQKAFCKNRKDR